MIGKVVVVMVCGNGVWYWYARCVVFGEGGDGDCGDDSAVGTCVVVLVVRWS